MKIRKAVGFTPDLEPDFSSLIQLHVECPEADCKLSPCQLQTFVEDGLPALQKSGEEFNVEKIPDSISLQKIQMNRYFLVITNISHFCLSFAVVLIKSRRTQTLTASTVSKNVLPIRGDKLKIKLGTSNVECVALWSHDYMKPATFALSDITVNMT